MKRKILASGIILLFLTLQCSIIRANEANEEDQINKNISVEFGSICENGELIRNVIKISEGELKKFEGEILYILEKIKSINSLKDLEKIVEDMQTQKSFLSGFLTKILSRKKIFVNRALVISNGHSYKINPFKKNDIKIRRKFTFWHYSNNEKSMDRTCIIKPFTFKINFLEGVQFGFMSRFTGIYIFIANRLPQKCHTFFMGTTTRINGMDFTPKR